MSTLGDTHGNPFFGAVGIGQANETHDNRVTLLRRLFQKSQFVADRIGKDCFKNETFALIHKFLSQFSGNFRRLISINSQFSGQDISIEKTQAAGF